MSRVCSLTAQKKQEKESDIAQVGEQYPSALVQGVDLSPIQPSWAPPNVKFVIDDAEAQWVYPPDHFDLIHARHTVQAFRDYQGMLAQAHKFRPPPLRLSHRD